MVIKGVFMNTIRNLVMAIASGCMALPHSLVLAQDAATYPSKLIKIIVPYPPGGSADIVTRIIGQKLGEAWKQPVVVENRVGGNGMIGADAVAKSPGDGYTYLTAVAAHAANVSLIPKAPYQLQKDLQPAAILVLIPLVPVVQASSPIRSLQDLVEISKRSNLNAGSSGNGTGAHLALELFKSVTGAKLQHVPYKGGAPAMTDLLGGQIDVVFALLTECLPHLQSGKLRALAVTTERRHALLPDVPTTAEAGILGIEHNGWHALMVPSSTSMDIVTKINAAVIKIVGAPATTTQLVDRGYEPVAMSVSDAVNFVNADVKRSAKIIREASIEAN